MIRIDYGPEFISGKLDYCITTDAYKVDFFAK